MSAQPACPYCGAKLFPHEVTNDQCGTCGGRLSGAVGWVPSAGEEPPVHREEPLTLPGRPPPEAFATVRQGVGLMRWGAAAGLIIGAVEALVLFAALVSVGDLSPSYFRDLLALVSVFGVLAALTVFVGVCFCCAVPRECNAARWARRLIPSLVAGGVLALIAAAMFIVGLASPSQSVPTWSSFTGGLAVLGLLGVGCTGWVCCFQLLMALARLFDDRRLARALGIHLILTLCGFFLGAVVGCAGLAGAAEARSLAEGVFIRSIVLLGWFVSGGGLMSWLLLLLTRLHRLIPVPDDPDRRGENPFLRRPH